MIRLPGLIDIHVHTRDPGHPHKEDWASVTAAALAGGFTTILAMPNTAPPVIDAPSLDHALSGGAAGARCDYGQYLGATNDNAPKAAALATRAAGLKLYLDDTFGPLRLDDTAAWLDHLEQWPRDRPIVAHAEGQSAASLIAMAQLVGRSVHITHVATRDDMQLIADSKLAGLPVTCDVTPHHLVLDESADLGGRSSVRPALGTPDDRAALWEHLDAVDCIATDHAPHLPEEKDAADPPPGFPGLETALPLLLTAVDEGLIDVDDLVERLWRRPAQIFSLPEQPDTSVDIEPDHRWQLPDAGHSRAGWTPFEGRPVVGRVAAVRLRGQIVYEDGDLRAAPGAGVDVRQEVS